MKRKLLILFLAIVSVFACILCFSACEDTESNDQNKHTHTYKKTVISPTCSEQGYTLHACPCGESYKDNYINATEQHVYDQKIPSEKHLKSEATCTERAVYYYTCICEQKNDETFEYGKLKAHSYKNKKCTECGNLYPTDGLLYELSYDESHYKLVGIGTAVDTDVIIACDYEGLPVTEIDNRAFYGCTNLKSVTMPNSITEIGSDAFHDCTSLESIIIPNSVTYIGEFAFNNCTSLTSVTIPDSVIEIYRATFSSCTNLTSINFEGTILEWKAINKDDLWSDNTGDFTIQCTDGKLDKNGNVIDE